MMGNRIVFVVCQPYLLVSKSCPKVMMRLGGRLTLMALLLSRVFVPHSLELFPPPLEGQDVAAKSIWKSKAPTKVCFFAWVATKDKIPTNELSKQMPYVFGGDPNHLVVHCHSVSLFWELSLSDGGQLGSTF